MAKRQGRINRHPSLPVMTDEIPVQFFRAWLKPLLPENPAYFAKAITLFLPTIYAHMKIL